MTMPGDLTPSIKPSVGFVLGFMLTFFITAWALTGTLATPTIAQQQQRNYERERALENSIDIKNLKDADARNEAARLALVEEVKDLKKQLREMELQVAQAKAGGYTLISAFGIALTILSIGQYVKLIKK